MLHRPYKVYAQVNTHCCQTLKSTEALLLGGGRFFKGLVLLNQVFHLVDCVAQLRREQVRLLGNQPGLGHGSISGKLVDLQDYTKNIND